MKLPIYTALFLAAISAHADWTEFRGPNADGTISADLPVEWSEEKNVTWKKEIEGLGWSTPVIKDGKIWITTAAVNGTTMSLLCFDYVNGDRLFDKLLVTCDNPEPLGNKMNTYATCTPVIRDDRIYVSFGSYGTFCVDTNTCETIWQRRDIQCSHWRGPGSSPILWKNTMILTFDGADQQFLIALDCDTGSTVWRTDRATEYDDDKDGIPANSGDMRKGYSTPFVVSTEGKNIMVSNSAKACWAYDPDTGKELWHVTYKTHSPSSRTVYSPEENLLYINTGLGKAEVWAIRLDPEAKGDISESHVVWKALKRTPKRSSPVLANGLLFFANDSLGSCVDPKTGEILWNARMGGDYSASLLAANGHVYFFDEDGLCTVVKADKNLEVVNENHLDAGFMASPSVYKNSLILRTKSHLYRIDK